MQPSHRRRAAFVVIALAVGVLLSRGEVTMGAGTFTASTTVTLSSTALSANADTTFTLTVPAPDLNLGEVIDSTPAAASIAPGPGNPAFVSGTHPALGDVVGTLSLDPDLGLANGPCGPAPASPFTLLNATVDITDTIDPVPPAATNPGSGGTLDNMWSDNGASTTGAWADPPWNAAWPGMDAGESANGLPAQVDEYPSYLNTIFTPDGGSPGQPLARYAGAAPIAGTTFVINLLVFSPNELAAAFPAPHPFHDLQDMGFTTVMIVNNPAGEAVPGNITDSCTSLLATSLLLGMAKVNSCNGVTAPPCSTQNGISNPAPGANTLARYANPGSAGTYLWVSVHQSVRDADADGKENAFDPCPLVSDTYDHRAGAGADADNDGIPDACDTNPNGALDSDGDGWLNRGDNCPQGANATQVETELTTPYTTAAKRGGPRTDGIGDACDPNPGVADGAFETTLSLRAYCIGGTDADADGWCATTAAPASPSSVNDPSDSDAGRVPEDYYLVFPMPIAHSGSGATPPMRQPVQVCNDGIDNDGDTLIDVVDAHFPPSTCHPSGLPGHPGFPTCPALGCAVDTDGDGFTDEAERHIGTDALGRCEVGPTARPSADWPPDLVASGSSTDRIDIQDLASFVAPPPNKISRPISDPSYNPRWDIVPTSNPPGIRLADLAALVAGATGLPPMFNGAKAFNGPLCTAHPTYGD